MRAPWRPRHIRPPASALAPADPAALGIPLDPRLQELRAMLALHRRRLWLRRMVRRLWIAAAAIALLELALAILQRLVPLEWAPLVALAMPFLGLLVLVVLATRVRPTLGETALAVDAESGAGDAIASALAFAAMVPDTAGPAPGNDDGTIAVDEAFDIGEAGIRLVRRQRRDAVQRLRAVNPALFLPRFDRKPVLVALVASALIAPALLLPNPMDGVIAQHQAIRDEAARQAERIDRVANDLEARGANADDPRTQLSDELRDLARRLRDDPGDLEHNLAQLGAIEDEVRAQLDPGTEQKAASIAALSRALSRAATANPQANPAGDPTQTKRDLQNLGDQVAAMTQDQRDDLAQLLAEQQGQASLSGGAAGQALRDAATSLTQGDSAGAEAALGRLGETLHGAQDRVEINRDLASAASGLQDARRELANAGAPGDQPSQLGRQSNGQGTGQGSANPSASAGSQGLGQGSANPSASAGSQGQGSGQGSGQGAGQGSGPGQGQGSGAIGGGGSSARQLGSGISSGGPPAGPTNPNRSTELGGELGSIYAPFDRLGRPGDPSYVAGAGGDGQTQEGSQQGRGTDNGSYVPYADVYGDFYGYALTALDRSYVPISVKDYVRDYFSSLDPSR